LLPLLALRIGEECGLRASDADRCLAGARNRPYLVGSRLFPPLK